MNGKLLISLIGVLLAALPVLAGNRATVKVHSPSMRKDVLVNIITPDKQDQALPVIYLLHGYGGNNNDWSDIRPDLPEIADRTGVIFVLPDGKNSWYWDSPKDPAYRYEMFVAKELVSYIDENYNTIADRNARAVTGLSMGGHGALWISFRNKDVFGAAGSTSGGVDIRPFPKNWEMARQLGEMEANRDLWETYTVINQIDRIKNGELALIIDCGYDDFFFEVNNSFHAALLDAGIDHDYLVRPGGTTGITGGIPSITISSFLKNFSVNDLSSRLEEHAADLTEKAFV